jgi:hypothetical protein
MDDCTQMYAQLRTRFEVLQRKFSQINDFNMPS